MHSDFWHNQIRHTWFLRFAETMKLKEIAAMAGIGMIYGLLMPGFSMRASRATKIPDCSWNHYVQVNGYGSDNVFGGTVRYEQYYDLNELPSAS